MVKVHVMTQDGFTLLTMGFTGAKVMQFTLQCITKLSIPIVIRL
jgi:phage regulator Rha-like protein